MVDISNSKKEEITNIFDHESFQKRENENDTLSSCNYKNDSSLYTSNYLRKNLIKSNNSSVDFNFVYDIFNSNLFIFNIDIIENEYSIEYNNELNEYKKLLKIKENYEGKYKDLEYETNESILLDNLEKLLFFILSQFKRKEFLIINI